MRKKITKDSIRISLTERIGPEGSTVILRDKPQNRELYSLLKARCCGKNKTTLRISSTVFGDVEIDIGSNTFFSYNEAKNTLTLTIR